jgi:general secretion pathway protein G
MIVAVLTACSSVTFGVAAPSTQEQNIIRAIMCCENLNQIGTALVLYANEHQQMLPPDLGTLLVAEEMDMKTFVCPASPNALPDNWQKLDPKQQAAWVNAHTDYIYLAAGKRLSDVRGNMPLAYEKDDDHGGAGMNVLFSDGALFVPIDQVHKTIGPQAGAQRATTRVTPPPGWTAPIISMDGAKALVARGDLRKLRTALMAFEIDNGRFPTQAEGLNALVKQPTGPGASDLQHWHGPYWKASLQDPWDHPYVFQVPGAGGADFDLSSAGPDGRPGSEDDVK